MHFISKRIFSILMIFSFVSLMSFAQDGELNEAYDKLVGREKNSNPVHTAVPFLTIAPDSRSGAMGDAGVATSPDANSMHWNPAKYAFVQNKSGFALTFTPWLQNLVKDIYLSYLSGYVRADDQQVFAGSLTYFTLGEITFTDNEGVETGSHSPNEFAVDFAYSRLFSDKFSGSLAFRFIRSDLTGGGYISNWEANAGVSFAADVSAYYQNKDISISDKDAALAFGMNISNIGTKISYTERNKEFIPINLGLGTAFSIDLDQFNSLTFALDANKLLVPTPPEYYTSPVETPSGDTADIGDIKAGMDPDVSVPVGMIQSFYDAPGIVDENGERNVFKEELQEIAYSFGLEYWYNKQFAVRAGYFYEHERKGNRKFFTVGMGLRLNALGIDFSYLIPRYYNNNPLANTVRFSLLLDMEAFEIQQ